VIQHLLRVLLATLDRSIYDGNMAVLAVWVAQLAALPYERNLNDGQIC